MITLCILYYRICSQWAVPRRALFKYTFQALKRMWNCKWNTIEEAPILMAPLIWWKNNKMSLFHISNADLICIIVYKLYREGHHLHVTLGSYLVCAPNMSLSNSFIYSQSICISLQYLLVLYCFLSSLDTLDCAFTFVVHM